MTAESSPLHLPTLDPKTGDVNVIIETPRDTRNKFSYDPDSGLFRLKKVLPAGAVFPHDFGFFPSTAAEDGDPLDVLVLMDESAFPGVLIGTRLIGAIEAEQTEKEGETVRNDRLIAIASASHEYESVKELTDLSADLIGEIEHFFVSYNQAEGRTFKPLGRADARRARALLEKARQRFTSS